MMRMGLSPLSEAKGVSAFGLGEVEHDGITSDRELIVMQLIGADTPLRHTTS